MRVCDRIECVRMFKGAVCVIASVGRVQCLDTYNSSDQNSPSGSGFQVAEILALLKGKE